MNTYTTLDGTTIDLAALSKAEQRFFHEMKDYFDSGMGWIEFGNLWITRIAQVYEGKLREQVAASLLFRVCQDMESRLALREGHTRKPTYRDQLADLISTHYPSGYQFCKETGLDQGFLSSVLQGKKDLSLRKLEEILEKANSRIAFVKQPAVSNRP